MFGHIWSNHICQCEVQPNNWKIDHVDMHKNRYIGYIFHTCRGKKEFDSQFDFLQRRFPEMRMIQHQWNNNNLDQ